jgi:anti-sigma factor RsiW
MKEENDILISRYLATDLPPPELATFEARLAAEPALAAELQRRKEELTFLRTEAALPDLETQMAALAAQHFQSGSVDTTGPEARPQVQGEGKKEQAGKKDQTAKIRSLNWKRWLPATGIAAAVALVLLIWNPFTSAEPYQQFAQYAPLSLTEKSSTNTAPVTAAQEAFNTGNYAEAHTQLINYLQQNPDDNEARLAFGIAALETNQDAEARAIFTQLANGTTAFKDDGQFYLALAYFKAGDTRAKAELEKISSDNPDFGVRVREMLQLVEGLQ